MNIGALQYKTDNVSYKYERPDKLQIIDVNGFTPVSQPKKSSCQTQNCHPVFNSSLESSPSRLSQPLGVGYKHKSEILWRNVENSLWCSINSILLVWAIYMPFRSTGEEWPLPTEQGFTSPRSAANFNSQEQRRAHCGRSSQRSRLVHGAASLQTQVSYERNWKFGILK